MERRYRSPYRHWVSGFAFEVALFVAFLVAVGIIATAIFWLAG